MATRRAVKKKEHPLSMRLPEADIAMIVHAMDSVEVYPYKAPQMRKVFAAFRDMLYRKSGRIGVPA